MSDSYPEYLNPFAEDVKPKSRLSISRSFKEFGRTFRQSFRIKKKQEEPVTIRKKTETFQRIPRIPVSYPNYMPDALPRSRFQERLKLEPSTSNSGPNPFEQEDKNSTKSTFRKKTKKKAPLPPKSLSSQDINNDNLDIPSRGSHWSLTSEDTNYSSSIQENGEDNVENRNEAVLEKIIDFNKEMEKLQDDSNNNIIATEEIHHDSNNDISKSTTPCPETDSPEPEKNEETDVRLPEDNFQTNSIENYENEEIVASDITNEDHVICENNKNCTTIENDEGTTTEIDDKEPFLYHEKQSLYIAGSKDELNDSEVYTNRISLQISDEDLDECNNNCDDNQSDTKSDTPVPKQRKNKLTKTALLGM